MGWLDQILNMLRGFDDYGAPNKEWPDTTPAKRRIVVTPESPYLTDEERLRRLLEEAPAASPAEDLPLRRPTMSMRLNGEDITNTPASLTGGFGLPQGSRRTYGGGFSDPVLRDPVGRPSWAPPSSDEDQLSSIYTTSALQQLATNKTVNPAYGESIARLRNARTLEQERKDLAPGRRVEAEAAEYLLNLSRAGKLNPKDAATAAISLVDTTRDQMTGAPDPDVARSAMDLIRGATTPVDRTGPSLEQPGASVGTPTERIGSGNSQWKYTVTGPDGDLWFSNDGMNWTNSRGVTRRGRLE